MNSAYDPQDDARKLYRENLWLRELLMKVAEDLEGQAGSDAEKRRRRAQRIRLRLHEGVPEEWRTER